MKNFQVVNYRIFSNEGNDVTDQARDFVGNKMSRFVARKIKNLMNILNPDNAPHRIAEVRITK